ncbi:hypothetical protein FA13DRAFT_1729762, partial [Coprinellus micaceus]
MWLELDGALTPDAGIGSVSLRSLHCRPVNVALRSILLRTWKHSKAVVESSPSHLVTSFILLASAIFISERRALMGITSERRAGKTSRAVASCT